MNRGVQAAMASPRKCQLMTRLVQHFTIRDFFEKTRCGRAQYTTTLTFYTPGVCDDLRLACVSKASALWLVTVDPRVDFSFPTTIEFSDLRCAEAVKHTLPNRVRYIGGSPRRPRGHYGKKGG